MSISEEWLADFYKRRGEVKPVYAKVATVAKKRKAAHETGKKNGLEQRFETEILAPRKMAGELIDYWFERVKLRLADNTYYTPDYFALTAEGHLILYETKGFWHEDARVKTKVAAEQYWLFSFRGFTWTKKEGWKEEVFS